MLNIYMEHDQDVLKTLVFDKIRDSLENIRSGKSSAKTVLMIVPAQFTLDAERTAFEMLGGSGFIDFQIMSGNKFKSDILKETGGFGRPVINRLGRTMLLRSIVMEKAGSFKAFSKAAGFPEFSEKAGDMIVSLKQNRISPKTFDEILASRDADDILSKKLEDIRLLFSEYEQVMEDKYTDSESRLALTAQHAPMSRLVRDSEIWYYEFYSFSGNETEFLKALASSSKGLNMAMLVPPDQDAAEAPLNTIEMLKRQIPDTKVNEPQADHPSPVPAASIFRCSTPFTQAETIAAKVLELLGCGEKPDSIAVLTGSGEEMAQAIKRVFTTLGIPFFKDEKRSVIHSPFISMLSDLLRIAAEGMRREAVLGMLKSGMLQGAVNTDRSSAEEFENYVKQYHIDRDKFLKPFCYGRTRFSKETPDGRAFERAEAIRDSLSGLLEPFASEMKKSSTVREKSTCLYRFLTESLKIPETLEASRIELAEQGFADAAEETGQLFSMTVGLLDQAVELLGEKEFTDGEYARLLTDSFRDIKVGLLPQAEGKITIGTVGRSKLRNVRYLFLAGVNEGLLPAAAETGGLLTEDELSGLLSDGYALAKTRDVFAREEELNIYKAVSAPSQKLYASYCLSGSDGSVLRSSALLDKLAGRADQILPDIENGQDPLPFLTSPILAGQQLTFFLREMQAGRQDEIPPFWKQVFNYLKDHDIRRFEAIKNGILFTNGQEPLSKKTITELLSSKNKVTVSPSGLEAYAACPFAFFVQKGLRPDEQEEVRVSPIEVGDIYHGALKELSRRLNKETADAGLTVKDSDSPWSRITYGQVREITSKAIDELDKSTLDGLMNSGKEEQYRLKRLKDNCAAFCWNMILQIRQGRIDEMFFETEFAEKSSEKAGTEYPSPILLDPITLETSAGKLMIKGVIDRFDVSGDHVKIIDYKSGNKKFERSEVESGFSLQLMIYLESALKYKADSRPLGVFYYNIEELSLETDLGGICAKELMKDIREKIESSCRLNGFYVDDPEALLSVDSKLNENLRSDIIDYKYVKTDSCFKSANAISAEEYDRFRESFMSNLSAIGERLRKGHIQAAPHKHGSYSACTYCKYHGICLFDRQFSENRYN